MKFSTVIFDLDGTLLDTLEDLKDSCNKTLKELGFLEITLEQTRKFVGNGLARFVEQAILSQKNKDDVAPETLNKAFELIKINYAENKKLNTKPYVGMPELLKKLSEMKIKMAIVSNKPDDQVKELQEKFFTQIPKEFCIGEIPGVKRKPAPDSVWNVLNLMNVQAKDAVFIGDSEVDLLTARNSGLECISACWGFRDKDFLIENGAKIFASSPLEILNLI